VPAITREEITMRRKRLAVVSIVLMILVYCDFARAQGKISEPKITVTGTLTRVMAIGGESTGWSIQFDSPSSIEGKKVDSIEVKFADPKQAENLENKRVKVTGTVTHVHGVESGERVVLVATSFKGMKTPKPTP
jgi:hypothetical protein